MEERLLKQVTPIGNGAHVFAPKEWLGEKVFIVRTPKKPLKEKILFDLLPHMENIIGIYLYGSQARKEAIEDSDIDLFIITSKKVKIKIKGYEIIAIEKNQINKAIKIEPLIIYSILSEAKPIINSNLLEELRNKYKPNKNEFKGYIKETKRIIDVSRQLLNEEEQEIIKAGEIAYSIILRLRGVYLIKQLLTGKSYSHEGFFLWVRRDIKKVYAAYRDYKNKSASRSLEKESLINLLNFLEREVKKILNDKKKKAS
jgi:predicted nucleotidyltransferase